MQKLISLLAVMVTSLLVLTTASSAAMVQFKVGDMVVENPWARATMSRAKNGAAYVTIKNTGMTSDRLISVTSPISKMSGAHQSMMTDGMMKMVPVKALDIEPGKTVTFKPGSYHIMFMGLVAPLKKGETFPMTLVFEKSGKVDVMVTVMKAGAMDMKPNP